MSGRPLSTLPTFIDELGTQAAQPTSGSVQLRIKYNKPAGAFRLDFTFKNARLPVTDAAASGSSASLKLFTFNEQSVLFLGCRQDYTSCVVSSAVDTGAGDVAYVMGLGTVAADAGDGALTATEVDVGAVTSTITNSGGTGAGTKHSATAAILDGTTTAKDVYLNWSGSAATCDANGTFDVNGTVSIWGVLLGDD